MCDFELISGLIIAAQTAFLACLLIVGVMFFNGSNPFTVLANIPAMIIAGSLSLAAAGGITGAIAALDSCIGGPCGPSLLSLRSALIELDVAMAAFGLIMIALGIVCAIPGASSTAAGAALVWGATVVPGFAAVPAGIIGNTIMAFNACLQQTQSGNDTRTTVIVIFSVLIVIASVTVTATSGYSIYKNKNLPKWW